MLPDHDWRKRADEVLASGSFEEVSDLLDEVVSRLEDGNLSLSDGLDFYEAGMRLSERAEQLLTNAELRVSQLAPDDFEDDAAVSAELNTLNVHESDERADEMPF